MTTKLEGLFRLDPSDYQQVLEFSGIPDFHLCCTAVLMRNNPGQVYVDDPDSPQSAFVSTAEGCYLIGEASNHTFNRAVNAGILQEGLAGDEVSMLLATDSWLAQVDDLFRPRTPVKIARRHYICSDAGPRAEPPVGFEVRAIDAELLNDPDLERPEHISRWIRSNWGSSDAFCGHGFGAATIDLTRDKVVSWSLADCISGDRAEIGIRTDPDYRRRGFAALTAAESVRLGLSMGLSEIGWQCSERNQGSIRTAEHAGFTLERYYTLHHLIVDEKEHAEWVAWLAEQE